MIFASWSPLVVLLGALAIAGVLFLLQRLRVHRRVVLLASAPLWTQAAREAPPRVLGGRFRRPLAYLLAVAIALALWLAASRPERAAAADGRFHLFYLDASALMTGGSAFAEALAALAARLDAVPPNEREVVLGDAYGTRLLAPGEDGALLLGRLGDTRAGMSAPRFGDWLRDATVGRRGALTVHYFGHRGAFAAAPLPGGATRVVAGYLAAPAAAGRGVVGLGVSPAASGSWGRADVFVALQGGAGPAPRLDAADLSLAGSRLTPDRVDVLGDGRYVLRDIPAEGHPFRVALPGGDGFAADDSATIVVPDRRALRVALGLGIPATIVRAIRLDPAFRIVDRADAQVVVRDAADRAGDGLPALVLSDPATEAATFVVAPGDDATDAEADATIVDRLDALGLAQIDAAGLADDLGRPVAVRDSTGRRSVTAWRSVFDAGGGFARSAALPLFVSQSLRWLARPSPWISYARAGEMLADRGVADDPSNVARRLNGDTYLPQAGPATIEGHRANVSLADPSLSRMAAGRKAAPAGQDEPGGYPDLPLALLLLAAAALLALEWRLYQRGWMP